MPFIPKDFDRQIPFSNLALNLGKEENMNAYLKKLEQFSPLFCEKIIDNVAKCCDRTKLVNYAQERVDATHKLKKQ